MIDNSKNFGEHPGERFGYITHSMVTDPRPKTEPWKAAEADAFLKKAMPILMEWRKKRIEIYKLTPKFSIIVRQCCLVDSHSAKVSEAADYLAAAIICYSSLRAKDLEKISKGPDGRYKFPMGDEVSKWRIPEGGENANG